MLLTTLIVSVTVCNALTQSNCNERPYNPKTDVCCDLNVFRNADACCLSQGMNSTTHKCCNGKVSPYKGHPSLNLCCGEVSYNHQTQHCCDNHVFDAADVCCLAQAYNSTTHKCCDGKVSPHKGHQSLNLCCGEVSYNHQTEECCDRQVFDGADSCCENQGFNSTTHNCCGGKVGPLHGHVSKNLCCGHISYNHETEICCGGAVKAGRTC